MVWMWVGTDFGARFWARYWRALRVRMEKREGGSKAPDNICLECIGL